MSTDRKYLAVVALLAIIAVVFGVTGTVAPSFEPISPSQSSSESVPPYFIIPPNFDSGWVDITSKCGQSFNVTHNLNTTEVFVDITGKQTINGGEHKIHFGGTDYTLGWSQAHGGTQNDYANSVILTDDGGYAVAGYTYSYGVGTPTYPNFWLVKTDWTGDKQWDKTYGGTNSDAAFSIAQDIYFQDLYKEEGYVLAGSTWRNSTNKNDFYLVQTDGAGNLLWERTYGGTGDDVAYSVIQTADYGFAIVGSTTSFASSTDVYLVKTDSSGNRQWSKTYGGTGTDEGRSVVQTGDSGYALGGSSNSYSTYTNFYLVKTDSAGNMQWSRTYGGTGYEAIGRSMIQARDGGYAITGYTKYWLTEGYRGYLVKTDSLGNLQWGRMYYRGDDMYANAVIQTEYGGYAIAGRARYVAGGLVSNEAWVAKTDSLGNMLWSNAPFSRRYRHGGASSVVETADGGYVAAGDFYIDDSPTDDFRLIKTEVESGLTWTESTNKTVTLYRGRTDPYWNFVRVRVWTVEEPTWQYGDINQDGVVDAKDLYILSQNYGKTFSVISLGGIAAIASVHAYKKRKQKSS